MPHRIEHPGDQLRVVRGTAHQLAGAHAVVIAGVEMKCAMEDSVAHESLTSATVADREVVAHRAGARLADAQRDIPPAATISCVRSCPRTPASIACLTSSGAK